MGKKIYVGNLPSTATETSLNDLFSSQGTIDSCRLITDRDTGRSKGFGFVEMSTELEAERAIANLNGSDHGGRTLTVNEARPKAPSDGYRGTNSRYTSDGGGARGY